LPYPKHWRPDLYKKKPINQQKSGSYFLGAFGQSGTYYIGTAGSLIAIKNIAKYPGFEKQRFGMKLVDKIAKGVSHKNFPMGGADFVVANAAFDKKKPAEWIYMLAGNLKLYVGKIKMGDVKKMKIYKLNQVNKKLTTIRGKKVVTTAKECKKQYGTKDPRKCKLGFGAGWNFQDEVFFSRNNGDGVFQINSNSIDIKNKNYRMRVVGRSAKTNQNDGMNCMDAEPPFPGECPSPKFEVPPIVNKRGKTKCPKYSKPLKTLL
jgi:hypothetical protein